MTLLSVAAVLLPWHTLLAQLATPVCLLSSYCGSAIAMLVANAAANVAVSENTVLVMAASLRMARLLVAREQMTFLIG